MSKDSDEIQKVVVNGEDIKNIKDYSAHFNVPVTLELQQAMDAFEVDMSYKNMLLLKLSTCKWLTESKHESFNDPLWNHPKDTSKDIIFDLQFDKDVEDELNASKKSESEN